MAILAGLKNHLKPGSPAEDNTTTHPVPEIIADGESQEVDQDHDDSEKQVGMPVEAGVGAIEAAQAIWGKKGRWLIIIGLALILTV
jgi:hypothetical protein